ncbi:hypothetical protein DF039_23885 [Burkholderia cenocepacia]|nr:hypothetical protein DF039_23885 [Burkholderia cenocepacia]
MNRSFDWESRSVDDGDRWRRIRARDRTAGRDPFARCSSERFRVLVSGFAIMHAAHRIDAHALTEVIASRRDCD